MVFCLDFDTCSKSSFCDHWKCSGFYCHCTLWLIIQEKQCKLFTFQNHGNLYKCNLEFAHGFWMCIFYRTEHLEIVHGPFQTCAVYFKAHLCVLLHTKTLVCHCWYYHLVLSYEMYFLGNQLTRVQNTYLGTHNEQDPGPL